MNRIEELNKEFARISAERAIVIKELDKLLQGKRAKIIAACARHGKTIVINHTQTDGSTIFCFGLGDWKPVKLTDLEILE